MKRDEKVFEVIQKERERQTNGIELIASENFVSDQVLEAMGSVMSMLKDILEQGIMVVVRMLTSLKTLPLTGLRNCTEPNGSTFSLTAAHKQTWQYCLHAWSLETHSWDWICHMAVTCHTAHLSTPQVFFTNR